MVQDGSENKLHLVSKIPTDDKNSHIGSVQAIIGSGKNALTGIAYMVLKWSFIAACFLSITFICIELYVNKNANIETVKEIWLIFIPIIGLPLKPGQLMESTG